MNTLSIRQALGSAWSLFEKRPWYLFGLTGAVIILLVLASGDAVTTALASAILAGYLAVLLKHARHEDIVFDDLFDIFDKRLIYFAFVILIKSVLILLGLLLFIVPGVYLSIKWMFSELYVLEKGMRPLEAMRASDELTKGYRWKLFLYVVIAMLVGLVGLLFLVVGVFAAVAVLNLATIMLFWKLQELQYKKSVGELE